MSRGFGAGFGVGTSDIVQVSRSFTMASQYSLAFWIYLSPSTAEYTEMYGAGTTINNFAVYQYSSNQILFYHSWTTSGYVAAYWPFTYSVWNHVCVTFNSSSASNVPAVYVNGKTVSATSLSGSPVGSANNTITQISAGRENTENSILGMMAQAALWNGVLLTAAEASALASGVSPLLIRPDSLVSYLPLDGINNPEPDLINGCSTAITGTRLGASDPPMQSAVASKTPTLLDMSINTPVTPWRRPALTYRRIAA